MDRIVGCVEDDIQIREAAALPAPLSGEPPVRDFAKHPFVLYTVSQQ
jgi:hypothetical protein